MSRPWDGIISDEEQRAYNASGFGRSTGIGKRPALLIIDVQYRTIGTHRMPFWRSFLLFRAAAAMMQLFENLLQSMKA